MTIYNEQKIIDFFDSILDLQNVYKGGIERYYRCPSCGRNKFALNIKKLKAHCWHEGIGYRSLRYLVLKHAPDRLAEFNSLSPNEQDKDIDYASFIEAPSHVKLPQEYKIIKGRNELELKAYNYLRSRNIEKDIIKNRYIGICDSGKYENAIIFPSIGPAGYVDFFVARWFLDNEKKYKNSLAEKNKIIFNELFIDWKERIILVEGLFDLYAISEPHTENVVPILGSSIAEDGRLLYTLVKNNCSVIVALDSDAKKKEDHMVALLRSYGVSAFGYNISEYGYKDPGDMGKKFWEYLDHHNTTIDIDTFILSGIGEKMDELV